VKEQFGQLFYTLHITDARLISHRRIQCFKLKNPYANFPYRVCDSIAFWIPFIYTSHEHALALFMLYMVRNDALNGKVSHVPSPPRSGEKVAGGRMRGLTG